MASAKNWKTLEFVVQVAVKGDYISMTSMSYEMEEALEKAFVRRNKVTPFERGKFRVKDYRRVIAAKKVSR